MPANTTFVSCSPEVGDVLGPDVMKSTKVIRRVAIGSWDPARLLRLIVWATLGSLCLVFLSPGQALNCFTYITLNCVTVAFHVLRERQARAMLRGVWQSAVLDSGHPGLHAAAALPGYGAQQSIWAVDLMHLAVMRTALMG